MSRSSCVQWWGQREEHAVKSQLALAVFQILCSSVFQRRKAELFFENGGKFSLIGIAHLFRYFGDGIFCASEKLSSFFHARFPKPGRDILAIDAAKVIFQAGFTDGEAFCNLANGNVSAQIARKDLRRSFCKLDLYFCVEAAGFWRPDFCAEKMVQKFKGMELQIKIRWMFRKPPELLKQQRQIAVGFVDVGLFPV